MSAQTRSPWSCRICSGASPAPAQAYNLEGPSVEEREFAVSSKPLTAADLEQDTSTLQDARIWDWRALEPQLQQIQGLRPYYTFSSVDIDRYEIDGTERQVMITARELDVTRLPAPAQVWVNLALKYTHGYGVVAVPVNEIDSRGNPVLWAHDIPIVAKKNLSVTHGEIYFGELTNDRVYVHTTEKEFDFPQGQANAETIYQGKWRNHAFQLVAQACHCPPIRRAAAFHLGIFYARKPGDAATEHRRAGPDAGAFSDLRSRSLHRRGFGSLFLYSRRLYDVA